MTGAEPQGAVGGAAADALQPPVRIDELEALVVDNPDLDRLELLLDRFNLFEAIGVVRQELRHSDVLAFMLDPARPHGLGDAVLKRLLQKTLLAVGPADRPISLVDVDVWDLTSMTVARESANVDLLLECVPARLAIVIENKIDSSEHGEQLSKYYDHVARARPGWTIIGIYLTPGGDPPSDERYLAATYGHIAEAIDDVFERRASTIGPDVRMMAAHYTDMLRRYIVGGSEVDELCSRIYRKHQRALDLIFERRPDQQDGLRRCVVDLINAAEDLTLDHDTRSAIRFLPTAWDVPYLSQGKGWTPSGRMLLFSFEFIKKPNRLVLLLYVGPGPEAVRQTIFDLALASKPTLSPNGKVLYAKWNCLWKANFLLQSELQDSSLSDLTATIEKKWEHFLHHDLPAIRRLVLAQPWMGAGSAPGDDPAPP